MRKLHFRLFLSIFAAVALLLSAHTAVAEELQCGSAYDIIPVPAQITKAKGTLSLPDSDVKVYIQGASSSALADFIQASALKTVPAKNRSKAHIAITIGGKAGKQIAAEGYSLTITPKRIDICASTETGAFYAVQTLLQITHLGSLRTIE